MREFIRRIKNLWRLSAYKIDILSESVALKKDIPTVKKKLAKIIEEKEDYFKDDSTHK